MNLSYPRVALLLPCFNEAATIDGVVKSFSRELPDATIYVYDNNSTDDTSVRARAAGAVVEIEKLRGKGNVVCRMFADIDADVYLLADGDGTYDATAAPALVRCLVDSNLDMVVGTREAENKAAYRKGHVFGNMLFNIIISKMFGKQFSDLFSGYRAFSKRFVKSFPILSSGFEIETQLSVHAHEMRMRTAEMPTRYSERPHGSVSKLHTYRDGAIILKSVLVLMKELRPMIFYGGIAAVVAIAGLIVGYGPIVDYLATGSVSGRSRAVLAAALMILNALCLVSGVVLDSLSRGRLETKRLLYLQHSSLRSVMSAGNRSSEACTDQGATCLPGPPRHTMR
jgi:glycosyltransferase involved in cell wall biosynthesis